MPGDVEVDLVILSRSTYTSIHMHSSILLVCCRIFLIVVAFNLYDC